MIIFGKKEYRYTNSPVKEGQNFIWVAEYLDGTYLSEYNFEDRKSNNFYTIDKSKLIKFGLIGMGSQAFFNIANGIFEINQNRIQISYIVEGSEFSLTGRTYLYNDIIQYKSAYGDGNLLSRNKTGRIKNHIACHSIGYKKSMDLNKANIHFKNVLHIPQDNKLSPYIEIKISSDTDLSGELVFRVNGIISNRVPAPLIRNMAGNYNWELI